MLRRVLMLHRPPLSSHFVRSFPIQFTLICSRVSEVLCCRPADCLPGYFKTTHVCCFYHMTQQHPHPVHTFLNSLELPFEQGKSKTVCIWEESVSFPKTFPTHKCFRTGDWRVLLTAKHNNAPNFSAAHNGCCIETMTVVFGDGPYLSLYPQRCRVFTCIVRLALQQSMHKTFFVERNATANNSELNSGSVYLLFDIGHIETSCAQCVLLQHRQG